MLNDFAPLGRSYIETDEAEADKVTAVGNSTWSVFASGQGDTFNTVEGWARDVTEDIAEAV